MTMSNQSETKDPHFSQRPSRLRYLWLLGIGLSLGAATGTASSVFAAGAQADDTAMQSSSAQLAVRAQAAAPIPARNGAIQIPSKLSPSEQAEADPVLERESLQDQTARLQAQSEWEISQHRAEPIDGSWSRHASRSLSEDLEKAAAEKKFRVTSVDCRNTSCLAVLEWPTYADALAGFGEVIHTPFAVNCVRGMTLPETDDPSRALSATLILDCSDWKKAGSEFLPQLASDPVKTELR